MENFETVPRSIETERALLGAILINPAILDQSALAPRALFSEAHQVIYRTMRALGSNRLDILTLTETLERKGKLTDIGGAPYIVELINDCPITSNWETYQDVIFNDYTRREVITILEKLARSAMDKRENINQAIAEAMTSIVKTAEPLKGTTPIKDHITELYNTVEQRAKDPKNIYGLVTGIIDFDKITHGMQKRETLILAGAPGSGKSILAFQIVSGMAEHGHPGCIYELEMSSEAVLRRKVSALSKIPVDNMRTGEGINEDWEKFVKALEKLADLPVFIADDSEWDPIQLRADLARRKLEHGIDWFLIDYMDLMSAPGFDKFEKSEYLSQQIHSIAKDLDLAGLIIHSMNKEGFKAAGLHTLSGSAKVGYDADQVVLIATDPNNKNLITLSWVKMREGDSRRKMKMIMNDGIPEFNCVAFEQEPEPAIADWTKI